jgi:DedD protein
MNHLLETEFDRDTADYSTDREISLGPGTILGIFFTLALICACFFGFGYSAGRHSAQTVAVQPVAVPTPLASSAAKPAAGSAAPPPVALTPSPNTSSQPAPRADAVIAGARPALASVQPAPAAAASGSFMVQVAAVSSQDIADIEVNALKKDGYAVVVRHESQDKLLHVQIGPFAGKDEAEAMRKRVQADGFNAIVK